MYVFLGFVLIQCWNVINCYFCLTVIYAVYSDYNGQFVTRKSMAHMVMTCEGTALPHAALSLFKTVTER